jgi:hypothetical protein
MSFIVRACWSNICAAVEVARCSSLSGWILLHQSFDLSPFGLDFSLEFSRLSHCFVPVRSLLVFCLNNTVNDEG